MLGKRGPLCTPTGLAVAAAWARRCPCRSTGTYSIDKARRLLGYEPKVDLTEGMARTEQWLRAQRLMP